MTQRSAATRGKTQTRAGRHPLGTPASVPSRSARRTHRASAVPARPPQPRPQRASLCPPLPARRRKSLTAPWRAPAARSPRRALPSWQPVWLPQEDRPRRRVRRRRRASAVSPRAALVVPAPARSPPAAARRPPELAAAAPSAVLRLAPVPPRHPPCSARGGRWHHNNAIGSARPLTSTLKSQARDPVPPMAARRPKQPQHASSPSAARVRLRARGGSVECDPQQWHRKH